MNFDKTHFIIASRKSPLALVQSEWMRKKLLSVYPQFTFEILPLSTDGDRTLNMPLATVGGKGLFVKELEDAILSKRADFAVHSSKDMPVLQPSGLTIAVFCQREDCRDAFISNHYDNLNELPTNAIIGTSSLRRQCLLKFLRPDIKIKLLRGNVQTRLKRLDQGDYDAIVLAAAGLHRQQLTNRIKAYFNPEIFIPAVTQGILCVECRSNDKKLQTLLKILYHANSHWCAVAERSMNAKLQGGCQVPIGALANINPAQPNNLHLQGLVGSPDGKIVLRAEATGDKQQAKILGEMVADKLIAQGATKILEDIYTHST